MGEKKKPAGWQNRKTGTAKQVQVILEKQEELKTKLQLVLEASDDTKAHANNKIIAILDSKIKPQLEERRGEYKVLFTQKGGNKDQKEARAKALESLNTEIEDLLVITNLMSLLASANPGSRRDYNKILRRPAKITGIEGNNSYEVSFRKQALQLLRDTLQGYPGDKDLLAPALLDEVMSIMIQFRRKMCLDCMVGGYGRNESEVATPCAICREPLCGNCLDSINKVTHTIKEKEIQEAKGLNLIQLTCS